MDINILAQEFSKMANQSCCSENKLLKNKTQQYIGWHFKEPWQNAGSVSHYVINSSTSAVASYFTGTTFQQIAPNYQKIDNLLNAISLLPDNWDCNGSVSLDKSVLTNAVTFISILPVYAVNELTENNIVPTPYGTLVFDWELKSNLISIEIGEKEIGFFTDFEDKNNFSSNGIPFNEKCLPNDLVTSFKKLFSNGF